MIILQKGLELAFRDIRRLLPDERGSHQARKKNKTAKKPLLNDEHAKTDGEAAKKWRKMDYNPTLHLSVKTGGQVRFKNLNRYNFTCGSIGTPFPGAVIWT